MSRPFRAAARAAALPAVAPKCAAALRAAVAPKFARAYTHGRERAALRAAATSGASGGRAFLPQEMMAVVDLFHTHASRVDGEEVLDPAQLKALLGAIGERPSDAELARLFELADLDSNGTIDLSEFLAAADQVLGGSPARYVLVVGGPGSGKGVLCERLVRECGVGHVSCGELLRDEVRADTPLGRDCDAIMRRGGLVPSVVITTLLRRRTRAFGGRRLLLDGFPRSPQNALDFERECGKPELALQLTCADDVMLERILGRGQGRADDNEATARQRIATFHEQGEPIAAWLRSARVPIIELDASQPKEEVWAQLLAVGRLMRGAVI